MQVHAVYGKSTLSVLFNYNTLHEGLVVTVKLSHLVKM